jgi:hypothetical protein
VNNLVPVIDTLPALSWKEKLAYLTYEFLKLEQTECPIKHIFENGNYIREMRIPAGTLFIGRAHRFGHECQLISGEVVHITPESRTLIKAPFRMHTIPGYHMVFQALTDIVGRTIHPNPVGIVDTEELEKQIFEPVENLRLLGEQISIQVEKLKCLV